MSGGPLRAPLEGGDSMERLREIVRLLRGPGGCPWDREQTHTTLIPNMLEEAYEAAEALRSGDGRAMEDELGDVLLQVVMHAQMGSECGAFDLESIAARVADKLVRRHPHVFGDVAVEDSAGVLRQWDAIKRRENGMEGASYLEGVGKGLPALMAADRLQRRAAKTGFDWPSAEAVLEKVAEETEEVRAVLAASCAHETQEELGDLLFSMVNLVRRSGFDAESLLSAANEKFRRRFDLMEQYLRDEGSPMGTASLEQMDAVWERVKTGERAVEAGC